MITFEESVVNSMDGSDKDLYTFLPYLLQDIWEIGTSPETVIRLIQKHFDHFSDLKVLDLGCGKGAVSVHIAKELGCSCLGIDALPEFVDYAQMKAKELYLTHLCTFENGDIRKKIKELSDYDILILGAIGPVFGNYFETLSTLSKCIKANGIFIIDDAYFEDDIACSHPLMLNKSTLLRQVDQAGMEIVTTEVAEKDLVKNADDFIFMQLKRRCIELAEQFPGKQNMFMKYIEKQEFENDVLENIATGVTMVIRKKNQDL